MMTATTAIALRRRAEKLDEFADYLDRITAVDRQRTKPYCNAFELDELDRIQTALMDMVMTLQMRVEHESADGSERDEECTANDDQQQGKGRI